MLTPQEEGKKKRYLGIKADALFHEAVPEGTEGAVYREYSFKNKETGETIEGSKWEILSPKIPNVYIKDIRFEKSDFGDNIITTFTDGDNEVSWSENTGSEFASSWMQMLPNVDFTKKITIIPKSYLSKKGKKRGTVNAYQSEDRVSNYFYDFDKREELNGFPKKHKPEEEMERDDWLLYFLNVKMFLVDYTKKNILPKFEGGVSPVKADYPTPEEEGIRPQDIPF